MKKNTRELIKLYENALGSEGYPRKEVGHTPQSPDEKLGHCRWMLDHMVNGGDPRFKDELVLANWLGFIQGVLFSEQKFALPALRAHADQLSGPQQEMKPVKTLPSVKNPSPV